jgi:hypothetical protein
LKRSSLLRFGAKLLDGAHHLFWLVNERLAELHRPRQLRIHFCNHVRILGQFLHVIVPGLISHFRYIIRVFYKARRLHDFQRVCRCGQNDRHERIGVQRDRHQ